MKKTTIIISSILLLMGACKKDNKTTPANNNNNNNNTTTNPYYFKFTLNGTSYNLNYNQPEYDYGYAWEAGGYQVGGASFFPSMGLLLDWKGSDTVKESDIMGLIGKTIYFNDTVIKPSLEFDESISATTWYSNDTANTNYYIKITNVVFLKKDTTLGNPLRTYVATGTCSAVMSQGTTTAILSGGSFNFIISRNDL